MTYKIERSLSCLSLLIHSWDIRGTPDLRDIDEKTIFSTDVSWKLLRADFPSTASAISFLVSNGVNAIGDIIFVNNVASFISFDMASGFYVFYRIFPDVNLSVA